MNSKQNSVLSKVNPIHPNIGMYKWLRIYESHMFEVVDKDVNMKVILAVMYTTCPVVKIRPEKNSGLYGV